MHRKRSVNSWKNAKYSRNNRSYHAKDQYVTQSAKKTRWQTSFTQINKDLPPKAPMHRNMRKTRSTKSRKNEKYLENDGWHDARDLYVTQSTKKTRGQSSFTQINTIISMKIASWFIWWKRQGGNTWKTAKYLKIFGWEHATDSYVTGSAKKTPRKSSYTPRNKSPSRAYLIIPVERGKVEARSSKSRLKREKSWYNHARYLYVTGSTKKTPRKSSYKQINNFSSHQK